MKKIAILAALVAAVMAAGVSFAEVPHLGPYSYKDVTEAQAREILALMLAQPDLGTCLAVARASVTNDFSRLLRRRDMAAFRHDADEALAAKGYAPANWWWLVSLMPKCSALARQAVGADEAYPQSVAIARRLGCSLGLYETTLRGGTLDDVAAVLSEAVAFPEACSLTVWAPAKPKIQKMALLAVKAHIRSQGRSFVTKNGVNPCEEYMTGLTTALNAPRFTGLDAWFKSVGLPGVDLSRMPSEEDVAKLKNDILYGRKDMSARNKAILEVCLGVEGYNAFVREYNGE